MWHYHNATHAPIPPGQLCELGCGQLATIKSSGGKYRCVKNFANCPQYQKNQSARVTEQWARPESASRKEKTKKTFLQSCVHNPEAKEKQKATLHEKFGWNSDKVGKDFRRYARQCRKMAQNWAKSQGFIIGKTTFRVDHKVSIWQAFQSKLPLKIVNHPENLEILSEFRNLSKGWKCSITVEELLKRIGITNFEPYDVTIKQNRRIWDADARKKASLTAKKRKITTCSYCKYTSTINVIKSFHNENCKLNPNYVKKSLTEKQKACYARGMSEETRKKLSESKMGDKHPAFSKTYEEMYGLEKAAQMKEARRQSMKKWRNKDKLK